MTWMIDKLVMNSNFSQIAEVSFFIVEVRFDVRKQVETKLHYTVSLLREVIFLYRNTQKTPIKKRNEEKSPITFDMFVLHLGVEKVYSCIFNLFEIVLFKKYLSMHDRFNIRCRR